MSIVYKLISPSGREYVGRSIHVLEHRFYQHCQKASSGKDKFTPLMNALRKYTADSWKKEILYSGSNYEIEILEMLAIRAHETQCPKGYNIRVDYEKREDSKWRKACKKAHNTPEVRIKHSKSAKKRWKNPDYRQRQTTSQIKASTPEVIKKRSLSIKKVMSTKEYKAKRSAITKNLWKDPEYRAKIIQTKKLDASNIVRVQSLLASGLSQDKTAVLLEVSQGTISKIHRGMF